MKANPFGAEERRLEATFLIWPGTLSLKVNTSNTKAQELLNSSLPVMFTNVRASPVWFPDTAATVIV